VSTTIGVVIPAYRAERYLGEALVSVAAQSRPPDRVVVVDDGSGDGTAEVARGWARGAPFEVRVVEQPNAGASAARNAGIRALDTELVALLDSDDVWLPDHLARAEAAFRAVPGLTLYFASHEKFDHTGVVEPDFLAGKSVGSLPWDAGPDGLRLLRGDVYGSLLPGNYVPPTTAVFRRSDALGIGLFDARFHGCEDHDFFLRLARVGSFAMSPRIAARYRVHPDNISRPANVVAMLRCDLAVLAGLLARAEELELSASERAATRAEARTMAGHLAYWSSTRGVRAYASAVAAMARSGRSQAILRPRDAARALVASAASLLRRASTGSGGRAADG
jgi:glycosyltransferase involved in cell wall biosynthesis